MSLTPGSTFKVNSRKYDGSLRRSWFCKLIAGDDEKLDLIGSFDQRVEHPDLGTIEEGTISRERFYLNRWYNYFVFEHPADTLRNYYINICMPPKIGEDIIDYVDLDIDVIVWPDSRIVTLDLAEFEANAASYQYPDDVRNKALSTLAEVEGRLRSDTDVRWAVTRL